MSIGEWVDQTSAWFFQAVPTSAKLLQMAVNQDRLLRQGQPLVTDVVDTHYGFSSDNVGRFPGLFYIASGDSPFIADVAFMLEDDFPFDVLRAWVFVKAGTANGSTISIYKRVPPNSTNGTLIAEIDHLAGSMAFGVWNEFGDVDITGWDSGPVQIGIHYDTSGATELECTAVMFQLLCQAVL